MFRFNAGSMDGLSSLAMLYAGLVVIGTVVVHLTFALAVFADSPPRRVLVSKSVWALGTLIAGPLVGGLYWLLHHGLPSAPRHEPIDPIHPA